MKLSKRLTFLLLAVFMMCGLAVVSASAAAPIKILVDGKQIASEGYIKLG